MDAKRPWLELPAFLALAFACALVANALAGPTRKLSWFPKAVPAAARATPVTATEPAPTGLPVSLTKEPLKPEGVRTAPSKTIASAPGPQQELSARFPPLTGVPQADLPSADALWLHSHGALFLDARRSAAYAQSHIAGAHCLPAWEDGLAEKVEQLALFTPDLKAPVVVYCSGGDCQDSHLVAQKLWLAGFRNLRIYTDGYPDWQVKTRPIVQGDRP